MAGPNSKQQTANGAAGVYKRAACRTSFLGHTSDHSWLEFVAGCCRAIEHMLWWWVSIPRTLVLARLCPGLLHQSSLLFGWLICIRSCLSQTCVGLRRDLAVSSLCAIMVSIRRGVHVHAVFDAVLTTGALTSQLCLVVGSC